MAVINLNDHSLIFTFINGKRLCHRASFGNVYAMIYLDYCVLIIKSFDLSLK